MRRGARKGRKEGRKERKGWEKGGSKKEREGKEGEREVTSRNGGWSALSHDLT